MLKIKVKNLIYVYKYEEVLFNISIDFFEKGFIGLIGYLGFGKLILFNIIVGFLKL